MNKLIIALAFVLSLFAFGGVVSTAQAGEYCKTKSSCVAAVKQEVRRQNAATDGRLWGPPSPSACEIASREQEGNERRCRSYDLKPGGKTWEECAKCYRQVLLDIARWEQCYRGGWAPKPPRAIYESLARLGRSAAP
jgi:hypothetical protein